MAQTLAPNCSTSVTRVIDVQIALRHGLVSAHEDEANSSAASHSHSLTNFIAFQLPSAQRACCSGVSNQQ